MADGAAAAGLMAVALTQLDTMFEEVQIALVALKEMHCGG